MRVASTQVCGCMSYDEDDTYMTYMSCVCVRCYNASVRVCMCACASTMHAATCMLRCRGVYVCVCLNDACSNLHAPSRCMHAIKMRAS